MTEQNPPAGVPSYPQAPPTARGFAPNGQQYAPWHLRVVAYIIDGIPPIIFFLPLLFGINWGALNSGTTTTPSTALCDAASQLCVYDLEEFLKPLMDLHAVEVQYREDVTVSK